MAIGKFIIGNLKNGKEYPCTPAAKADTPPNILDIDGPATVGWEAETIYFVRDNGEVWLLKNRHGPDNVLLAKAS